MRRVGRAGRVEGAAFVLSVALLAFLYGVATQAFGWPPSESLTRTWHRFRRVSGLESPEERLLFLSKRVYDRSGARTVRPGRMAPGLTLIASYWADDGWRPSLRLVDASGATVHAWAPEAFDVFPDSVDARARDDVPGDYRQIHGFRLDPDTGEVLANVEHRGTVRLDACGDVIWTVERGNHHSIEAADDGSLWIPGAVPDDETGYGSRHPGLPDTVMGEWILHVSPDGEVLQTIDVLDVLFANGLQRRIAQAAGERERDFMHLNDVEPLSAELAGEYPLFEAGDLLVSLRNLDLVFVLDPRTERVKWSAWKPFVRQHDPDWTGDGWIGVFDNRWDTTLRGTFLGGSRVVAVRPGEGDERTRFPTPASDPFYTPYMGQWQRLENGDLLLVESEAGRVVEVSPDGRTVWEWGADVYEEAFVPWVTGALRYPIGPEDVAAWRCRGEDRGSPGAGLR